MDRRQIVLPIEDFGYMGSGAIVIERALVKVAGVLHVYVNAATEMAYVQYDADRCTIDALREALAHAGFRAGTEVVP